MCVIQALKMRRQDDCHEFSSSWILLWDLVSETGKRRKERGARKVERREEGREGKVISDSSDTYRLIVTPVAVKAYVCGFSCLAMRRLLAESHQTY